MSPSGILYLIGFFSIFLAERMFSTSDAVRWPLLGLGGLLVLGALLTRSRTMGKHPGATRAALGFYAVSIASLGLYVASGDDRIASFGLTGDSATHAKMALQALAPLLWAIGALPALAIDRTLFVSPHSVHPRRLHTAIESGLAVAMGIGMLFPVNWLAQEYNERWDFGFFKTTAVGESTRAIVENLTEPVRVVLFFPTSSEVVRELDPYFEDLKGANLTVEVMDAAMAPDLSKEWKIKENGVIAFARGEAVETIKIGEKLDAARKELRKLDSKVQTALLKMAREKRTVYFTVGHDEFFWKNAASDAENIDLMKKAVESLNFKVKELGLGDGLGDAVPDDAAVVFVTGPRQPFLPEEINALKEYRDRGGAVFLMLEPTDTPDPELAAIFGLEFSPTLVVTDKDGLRVTGGLTDRAYIFSDKFSSHESVTALSRAAGKAMFVTPQAGSLKELAAEHVGKVTITVKSMSDWWSDYNGNYGFDKDTEKRGGLDMAAVATGPSTTEREWRVAAVADASWAANPFLSQVKANQVYLVSAIAWLTEDPALAGEVQNEEDVKIQHTKEDEAVWFYGTSALVPALIFLGGMFRVNNRRRKGAV